MAHWIIASVVCLLRGVSSCALCVLSFLLFFTVSIDARTVSFCSIFTASLLTFTLLLQEVASVFLALSRAALASWSEDEKICSFATAVDGNDEDAHEREEGADKLLLPEEEEEEEEEEGMLLLVVVVDGEEDAATSEGNETKVDEKEREDVQQEVEEEEEVADVSG